MHLSYGLKTLDPGGIYSHEREIKITFEFLHPFFLSSAVSNLMVYVFLKMVRVSKKISDFKKILTPMC